MLDNPDRMESFSLQSNNSNEQELSDEGRRYYESGDNLKLPAVNVLPKVNLLSGSSKRKLDHFLTSAVHTPPDMWGSKHHRLSEALGRLFKLPQHHKLGECRGHFFRYQVLILRYVTSSSSTINRWDRSQYSLYL